MLIEDQLVEMTWERRNKPDYINKGYNFTNIGDTFLVKPQDLAQNSIYPIWVECDYCGEKYQMLMRDYNKRVLNHEFVKKCACLKCRKRKSEETCLLKYGVKTNLMLDDTKDKIKNTNIEKYGVENPAQNKEVQDKMKATMLERYGVEYSGLSEELREKQMNTNLEKYGVKHTLLNEEIKTKAMKTMFENNKVATSRTQHYLHLLLGGDINFPLGSFYIDILLDNKIAIEYDGGGHNLQVKLGNVTKEEFVKKERNREYFLKRRGYKIVRVVSSRDKLPKEDILMSAIGECIDYVSDKGTNSEINIDESYIRFGSKIITYDYGNLIRMDKEYFVRNNLLTS